MMPIIPDLPTGLLASQYEKVIIICHSISVGAGQTELESDWSRAGPRLNLLFFAYSQE